jgi:hypothetical protein
VNKYVYVVLVVVPCVTLVFLLSDWYVQNALLSGGIAGAVLSMLLPLSPATNSNVVPPAPPSGAITKVQYFLGIRHPTLGILVANLLVLAVLIHFAGFVRTGAKEPRFLGLPVICALLAVPVLVVRDRFSSRKRRAGKRQRGFEVVQPDGNSGALLALPPADSSVPAVGAGQDCDGAWRRAPSAPEGTRRVCPPLAPPHSGHISGVARRS